MARVKALVNNTPIKLAESEVTREGERAIDQTKIIVPACSAVCIGCNLKILQDAVDLSCMVGGYMFQGNALDESGLDHNSFGCVQYPRIDTRLVYDGGLKQNGYRDTSAIDAGTITGTPGKVNTQALCFDGTSDYIIYTCESIFDLDLSTPFSHSVWLKTSDVSVPIISKKATGAGSPGYEISLNSSGQVALLITNTTTSNELHIRGDTAVNTCVWTHIAVTYSGVPTDGAAAVKIYVNGKEDTYGIIATTLTSTTLNCSDLTYGAYADGSSKYAGVMDDAALFISKVLTEAQVRSMFQQGTIKSTTGKYGDAVLFNGIDSYYEVPYSTDYDFTATFDIQLWAKWSTTTLGYIFARRTLSGNGIALSVNRLATGDIVAEIDGNNIKTCGTAYNDNAWHFIRIYRGTDNVVHLEVDNVAQSTATVGSNLTLSSPELMIGTNHNRTAYFDGAINMIRLYTRVLSTVQVTRLYSEIEATSIMKFGGTTTKLSKEIIQKEVIAQSKGEKLGTTEVRAQQYNNRTPEFIIDDLVRNNTDLIPHIHGSSSGIILSRFNADGKLIDIIRDLTQLTGRTFNTDPLGRFHMHDNAFNPTCFVFTHGSCSLNFECVQDDTEIINDLVVIGETKRYDTVETFSGDACKTQFCLTFGATTSRVLISGVEKKAEEDYNTCVLNKTITFVSAPASASCNITVEYQYEIPLLIRGEKQSSIDINGRHSKRMVMPWIRTRNDGIRFINGYLNRYKEIRTSLKLTLGVIKNSVNEGDVVRVVNNVKNIDGSFVVKSLTWRYPEMKTVMLVGEFKFDDLEYEKQIIEKLHDLESALTEIKDIRCSEQLEEVMCIADNTNIITGLSEGLIMAESMSLNDVISLTIVVPAVYDQSYVYCGDDGVYGTEIISAGFTESGFTGSGFTAALTATALEYNLLLETGDFLLKEDSDKVLGEGSTPEIVVADTSFTILLENGSAILIENGDNLLLDTQDN